MAGEHVDLAEGAAAYRLRAIALGFGAPQFAEPVEPVALPGRDADAGSFGWAVLGFFIPPVGLILWMIRKNDRPGDAGMAGKGALVSVIINVVLFILWIVFAGILFAASGSY